MSVRAIASMLLLGLVACADDATLEAVVRRYVFTAPPSEREKIVPELAPFDATPYEEVRKALRDIMPRPPGSGILERRAMTNRREIRYAIALPKGYDPSRAWPVLLALMSSSAEVEEGLYWWPTSSLDEKYVVVSPALPADDPGFGGYPLPETGDGAIEAVLGDLPRAVHVDPSRVFVAGFGAGGNLAWSAAVLQADRLAGALPMWGTPPNLEAPQRAAPDCLRNTMQVPLFIAHGDRDTEVDVHAARQAVALLKGYGLSPEYHELAGVGRNWSSTLEKDIVAWLEGKRRVLFPKEVSFRVVDWGRPTRRMYWVEMTKGHYRARPDSPQTEAEIVGRIDGNRIELSTKLMEKVTVWLNPLLVDLSKEVTVVVNGVERFRGVVRPSLQVALDGFRERWDPEDVYSAKVLVEIPK